MAVPCALAIQYISLMFSREEAQMSLLLEGCMWGGVLTVVSLGVLVVVANLG
jgi:hypothetical protein